MKQRKTKWIVLFFGIFLLICILGLSIFSRRGLFSFQLFNTTQELVSLWNTENFEELYAAAKEILEQDPFNKAALQFYGYAALMLGYWHPDETEKEFLIEESIVTLRRLMLLNKKNISGEHAYMLGKAYFYLQHYNRSLEYLEASYERNYQSEDIDEYLITLYDVTEQGDKLAQLAKRANGEGDIYIYATGRASMLENNFEQATEIFSLLSANTMDLMIKRLASVQLARIYYETSDFSEATKILHTLLDSNPVDTEVLHLLGDTHGASDDLEAARYYWREVLRLEPHNREVINKLKVAL